MGVRFACHHCGKRLNIKRELAGKRGICPACSTRFRIPLEDAERSQPLSGHPSGRDSRNEKLASAADPAGVAEAAEPSSGQSVAESQSPPVAPAADAVSGAEQPSSLADEPSATWYVRPPSGGQYGPATSEVLREWVEEGRLAASALVWRDGWPQWRVAREAFPEWVDRLPGGGAASTESAAAPSTGSESAIEGSDDPVAGGEPALQGDANVAARRRQRSWRRVVVIALLFAVSVALVAALAIILVIS